MYFKTFEEFNSVNEASGQGTVIGTYEYHSDSIEAYEEDDAKKAFNKLVKELNLDIKIKKVKRHSSDSRPNYNEDTGNPIEWYDMAISGSVSDLKKLIGPLNDDLKIQSSERAIRPLSIDTWSGFTHSGVHSWNAALKQKKVV